MGVSMISPEGLAISPRMPASCRIWSLLPRAPESAIMKIGLKPSTRMGRPSLSRQGFPIIVDQGGLFHGIHHFIGHIVRRLGPDIDHLIVFFPLGDQPFRVLPADLGHLFIGLFENIPFLVGDDHGVDGDGKSALCGVLVTDIFQPVRENDRGLGPQVPIDVVDQFPERFLVLTVLTVSNGMSGRLLKILKTW